MAIDGLQDSDIRDIFDNVRTIAVVGASSNPDRPSHYVSAYLQSQGFRVVPVNPGLAGQELLGEPGRHIGKMAMAFAMDHRDGEAEQHPRDGGVDA